MVMAAELRESAFKSPNWQPCKQPLAILGGLSHRGGGKSMLRQLLALSRVPAAYDAGAVDEPEILQSRNTRMEGGRSNILPPFKEAS